MMTRNMSGMTLALCAAAGFLTAGCGKSEPARNQDAGASSTTSVAEKKGHDHGGWWCTEHGIPEHECLMCLYTEAQLKKKGDWCDKHDRAKSQCFVCDPSLKEKYAAKYRAKYGKEPPPTTEEAEKIGPN